MSYHELIKKYPIFYDMSNLKSCDECEDLWKIKNELEIYSNKKMHMDEIIKGIENCQKCIDFACVIPDSEQCAVAMRNLKTFNNAKKKRETIYKTQQDFFSKKTVSKVKKTETKPSTLKSKTKPIKKPNVIEEKEINNPFKDIKFKLEELDFIGLYDIPSLNYPHDDIKVPVFDLPLLRNSRKNQFDDDTRPDSNSFILRKETNELLAIHVEDIQDIDAPIVSMKFEEDSFSSKKSKGKSKEPKIKKKRSKISPKMRLKSRGKKTRKHHGYAEYPEYRII